MADVADLRMSLDEDRACNCEALFKASRRISQLYDVALSACGLTANQRSILAEISRSPSMTMGKLAEALIKDPGAVARALKPLERDGLIAVRIDATDRRHRLIALTDAGEARLREADALWEKAQHCFEEAFGKMGSPNLQGALEALSSNGILYAIQRALRAGRGRD